MGITYHQFKQFEQNQANILKKFEQILLKQSEILNEIEKCRTEFKKCDGNFDEMKHIFKNLNITFE
jgi:hypothetical protein